MLMQAGHPPERNRFLADATASTQVYEMPLHRPYSGRSQGPVVDVVLAQGMRYLAAWDMFAAALIMRITVEAKE